MDLRSFSRQFLTLFSGTASAQLINLASYPLLVRIYAPDQFGLFGTFIAASAIPGAIACGRFDLAITTAPERGQQAMMWLCILFSTAVSGIATLGIWAYWQRIGMPSLGLLVPMLFLSILLTGVSNAIIAQLVRRDSFRIASFGLILRTIVTVAVQLAAGLVWPSAGGLILGFGLGLLAQVAIGLLQIRRRHGMGRPVPNRMRAMFRRFRYQVSVDIPGTLLGALSINLLPFFLQSLYGVRAVGFYLLGQRIAVQPLQLFNESLSQVFFQRAARAQEERGEFWPEFRFTLLSSGLICIAVVVGLVLFARPVVKLYLGPGWDTAGTILVILAPMLAVRSVTMVLATAAFVVKRPGWLLGHNIASVAAIALAFVLARTQALGLEAFFTWLTILQGLEYALFGIFLGLVVWRRYLNVEAGRASIS